MNGFRLSCTVVATAALASTGCSWVDSSGRQENRAPGLSELTQVVLEERESVSLGVADADRNLDKLEYTLVGEGSDLAAACVSAGEPLSEVDEADFALGLEQACDPVAEQTCGIALEHELLSSEVWISDVPKLRRPVALQYRLNLQDSDGASTEQLFTLCVASESSAPVAADDSFDVEYNRQRVVEGAVFDANCRAEMAAGVLANDSDDFDYSEDEANAQRCLVAELRSPPNHHQGVFTLAADGGFSYGAGTGLGVGQTDSFTYVVSDGVHESEEATVVIRITGENTPPTSREPDLTINEDEVLLLTADDLAQDGDPGELVLQNAIAPAPTMGVLEKLSDPARLRYTPNANESGSDSFGYRVADAGGAVVDVNVDVTIVAVNDRPVIAAEQGTSVTLAAGGDTDTLLFTVSDVEDDAAGDAIVVNAVSDDTDVVTAVASEEFDAGTAGNWQVDFTAVADGAATVTLTATDSDGDSNAVPMRVDVVVGSGNQRPTVDDPVPGLSTSMGTDLVIHILNDGIADDPDGDNTQLQVDSVSNMVGGSVVIGGGARRTMTFTPAAIGTASFELVVVDEDGATGSGTITVDVTAVATQAPVVQSPALTATVGVASTWHISTDGLATDADTAATDLVFSSAPTSADGVIVMAADSKSFSFTPASSGAASIAIVVEDPEGNSDSGTLSVTVSAVANVDPTVTDTTLDVVRGIESVFALGTDVAVGDSDGNAATVVVDSFSGLVGVSVDTVLGQDRQFAVTGNTVGAAAGSFVLQVEDEAGGTGQGTITVNVAANQAPTVANTALSLGTVGVALSVNRSDLGIADVDSPASAVLIGSAVFSSRPLGSATADLSVGGGTSFSFTPDVSGDYVVEIGVEDEVNNDNHSITVTVP